jgi:hypothetical protein
MGTINQCLPGSMLDGWPGLAWAGLVSSVGTGGKGDEERLVLVLAGSAAEGFVGLRGLYEA